MTNVYPSLQRTIADTNDTDLGQSSCQSLTKTSAIDGNFINVMRQRFG